MREISTALITGHRGVLGSRIRQTLVAKGLRVLPFLGDITCKEDIFTTLERTNSLDLIVNCAAIVPVNKARQDPLKAFEVNARAPGVLASVASKLFPGLSFLQVSTSHVYSPSDGCISETDKKEPSGTYGRSKYSGELQLEAVAEREDLKLCIARVFSMYSHDQGPDFLFSALQTKLAERPHNSPIRLWGWNNTRDFLSADQVAEKVTELSLRRLEGVVNVASGHAQTVGEFAALISGQKLEFLDEDKDPNPTRIVANVSLLGQLLDV